MICYLFSPYGGKSIKEKLTSLLLIFLLGFVGITCKVGKVGFGKKDDDKKDKENATNLLGLVYLDQISGHCAEVKKNTSGGQTYYSAFLYPIPKGGCNADTIYGGTTYDAIKQKLINDLSNLVSIIDNEFPNECPNTKNLINSMINNESNSLAYLVNFTLDKLSSTKFYPIGSMIEEAKNNLISSNTLDDITTEEDVRTLTPASLDEYKRYSSLFDIFSYSASAFDSNCISALQNKLNTEFPASKYFRLLPITVDNTNKNNKVLFTQCSYGSYAPPSQKCTSLNEEF